MKNLNNPQKSKLPVFVNQIPQELKDLPHWVNWRLEERGGKKTKIPKNPRTGGNADVSNPDTWAEFSFAWARFEQGGFSGIGYVFTDADPYCGIDLDKCMNPENRELEPWALKIIQTFSSYTEISPSGKGIHIILRGNLQNGNRRQDRMEVYDNRRYFTITGDLLKNEFSEIRQRERELNSLITELFDPDRQRNSKKQCPEAINNIERSAKEVLNQARKAKNGKSFTLLYDKGDWRSAGYPSQSEADAALCSHLWFWTGDRKSVDQLFRSSSLMRAKWDERHYGDGRSYGQGVLDITCHGKRYTGGDLKQQDFPFDALPEVIKPFVRELANSLPVPIDLPAVMVLSAASGAIGSTRMIRLKSDWLEPASLYVAIVANSGQLKSPALTKVMNPLYQLQKCYEEAFQKDKETYDRKYTVFERDLSEFRKKKLNNPPDKPNPPVMHRTWVEDVTVERLSTILKENPRGVIMIRDELVAWARGLNQYKRGRGSDREFYLSVWSGSPVAVDRQTRDPLIITKPFLSIVGCIPPQMVKDLQESEQRDDGFLTRILFSFPDPVKVLWTNEIISEEAQMAYSNRIRELLDWKSEPLDVPLPLMLDLSEEARTTFLAWHDQHCEATEKAPTSLKGVYAKMKGYCARLALIHALLSDVNSSAVENISINAAIKLVNYFLTHARRVYSITSFSAPTPQKRCEGEILRQLKDGKEKTRRELAQGGNARTEIFKEVLGALFDTGEIIEILRPGKRGTKKVIRLNSQGSH